VRPASDPTPPPPAAAGGDERGVGAFFDVDNTIIRGASAFHLAKGLHRHGFFRAREIVWAAFQQARYLTFGENTQLIDEVRTEALAIMRGHSVADVLAVAEDVYDEVLNLRIFPDARRLIEGHLRDGHQVWLITASPVEVAELIARRIGATGALGSVAEVVDGRYTGRLVGDLLHGRAKAEAARGLATTEHLDLARSYAYGDSTHDIPLLSEVGHPCAINPDRRLRRYARKVGWPIDDFRRGSRAERRAGAAASAPVAPVVAPAGPDDAGPADDPPTAPGDATAASGVVVRPATPDDVAALAALAALAFPLACPPGSTHADQQVFIDEHLSAERFAQYVTDPDRRVLLAEPAGGGESLGYTMLVLGEPADADARAAVVARPTAELSKCYVHPDRHGSGVATALMAASLDAAREAGVAGVWLGVNQLNARARRFYERSGFVIVGTKHFHVGSRIEDDYVLERPL
jgi:HAD superfamily hydrolase (TIGR01490 family)